MHGNTRFKQAAALRALRKRHQLTQEDLEAVSGVTQQAISNYERGKVDMPFSRIVVLCAAMQESVVAFANLYEAVKEEQVVNA
jgi:transcriptional regulator with XRE-family HTH domain